MITPASVRHSLLVVGVGSIGERHLRCFLKTGRANISFVETNPILAEAIAQRYPDAVRLMDIDSAIENSITCAAIATPASSHVPLARRLVGAGAHVLIEKPLSVSLDAIELLREEVQKAGLIAAVAYVYRAHPALADMHAKIASGRFGNPLQVICVSGQHFPTYRPAYAQTYYTSRETGGGAVQDALTHMINIGQWFVGPLSRLVADVDHQTLKKVEVEDTAHVLGRHGSVLGAYTLNQYQPANETTFIVVCERAVARFEYHDARWRFMERPDSEWVDQSFGPLYSDDLFTRQANNFLDSIEGTDSPLCSLNEGIDTLKTNMAILESAACHRWIELSYS